MSLLSGLAVLAPPAWAGLYDGVGAVGDCTGVAISSTVVLSAAHCFAGVAAETVSFQGIAASRIDIAPGYVGFGTPDFDNDLAAIVLSSALDPAVPIYQLVTRPAPPFTPITFVHRDGSTGNNVVNLKNIGGSTTFAFDYDDPNGEVNLVGGTAVSGEDTLRSGDSGGGSFVLVDGVPRLLGINTFLAGTSLGAAGEYGSIGGGLLVSKYQDFLSEYVPALKDRPGFNRQLVLGESTAVPEPGSALALAGIAAVSGWVRGRRAKMAR
jgi:hypothetical protein